MPRLLTSHRYIRSDITVPVSVRNSTDRSRFPGDRAFKLQESDDDNDDQPRQGLWGQANQIVDRQRVGRSGRRGRVRDAESDYRRGDCRGFGRDRRRHRSGRQSRAACLGRRIVGDDGCRRSRPAIAAAGRPGRCQRQGIGGARIAQLRQDDQRLRGRHGRSGRDVALLRRLGRQDRRAHRAGARQLLVVYAASAGRRRGPDHSVELSTADAGLEMGTGAGLRQHSGDEAGRADAAHRACGSASWRSRPASRPV